MKIYGTNIDEKLIEQIIIMVKQKKELSFLDNKKIGHEIEVLLNADKKLVQKLASTVDIGELKRSKSINVLIKKIRSKFYRPYTLFQSRDAPKRHLLLKELEKSIKDNGIPKSQDQFIKLLETHISSKERISNYNSFYEEIFLITKKPKSILDIGCGLNPVSYPFMKLDKVKYYACDISQDEMDFLNGYFDMMRKYSGLDGHAFKFDIKADELKGNMKDEVDAVFAFKLIDLIDSKSAEKLLDIKCKWIAASFSTKTISGKLMNSPRRAGFQKMLRRLNKEYVTKTIGDEIIYLIKNNM